MAFEVVETSTRRVVRSGISLREAEDLAAALSMRGVDLELWRTDGIGIRITLSGTAHSGCITRSATGGTAAAAAAAAAAADAGAGLSSPPMAPTQHGVRDDQAETRSTNREPTQHEVAMFRRAARALCRLGDAGLHFYVAEETIYLLTGAAIEGGEDRHERVRATMHVSRATGGDWRQPRRWERHAATAVEQDGLAAE